MRPLLRIPLLVTLLGLAASGGSVARIQSAPSTAERPTWTQVSWPFLLDQWGYGRAYRCAEASCGAEARLFLRVKRGFCNCQTGIADDEELDRLTDFDFFGGRPQPLGPGRPLRVREMAGRVRSFAVEAGKTPDRRAVSVAVAADCEAVVALVTSDSEHVSSVEPRVLALLAQLRLADLD